MAYPLIDFFRVYRCIRRSYSFHGGADKFPDTSVQKFFPGITASYFIVCALAEETVETQSTLIHEYIRRDILRK